MLHTILPAFIFCFTLLACLDGTFVHELPQLDFDSVAKAYQDGNNRLIVVHVDGLLPNDASAVEEKKKLEVSLSKLAKDVKNEICLVSDKDVGAVRGEYTVTERVRIIGNNGKRLFHPRKEKGYPAQTLPEDEIEGIKNTIVKILGSKASEQGLKYKVKIGVNPLVIDRILEDPHAEYSLDARAGLLELGTVLQQKHKAVGQSVSNPFGIWVDFEHGNDVIYPIDGLKRLKEEYYEVFEVDGATLTPLLRDFGLSVGDKGAETFHEAMNEAKFFSATVIPPDDKQTSSAKGRLADIKEINEYLRNLADMADN